MDAPADNNGEADGMEVSENAPPPQQSPASENDTASEKRWPGWPGETVFRVLIPSHKAGSLIGRKGESIKKLCEESRARIKILDGPPGAMERAVMISAKEEQEAARPPAIDGLLRVLKRTLDSSEGEQGSTHASGSTVVSTRLLVAASQTGCLIGRQGATIKSIQESSNCIVRVLGPEDLPALALPDDRVVEIQGQPVGVHKAVELIASNLRKFLVDRSVLPLFEVHISAPPHHSQIEPPLNMPPLQPWGLPPGPPNPVAFGNDSLFMPPRPHDNYFPPSEYPPMDKQPHPGLSMFGREQPSLMVVHSSASAAPPSQPVISQVTQQMQIPLSFADAIIGKAGSNISYIRRASGAAITILETKGVPGEMTAEINGSATQVQTAQQLIQNFMAEAAGPAQTQPSSVGPGYGSSYQSHGSVYPSPTANAGHPPSGGGYGSVYGSNYGY